jgi:hypothetical protein
MSCTSPPPSSSSSFSSTSAVTIGKHEIVVVVGLLAAGLELAAGVVKAKAAKATLPKKKKRERRECEGIKEERLSLSLSLPCRVALLREMTDLGDGDGRYAKK